MLKLQMLIIAMAGGGAAYINGLSIWVRNNNKRLVGTRVIGICLASFPVLSVGPCLADAVTGGTEPLMGFRWEKLLALPKGKHPSMLRTNAPNLS